MRCCKKSKLKRYATVDNLAKIKGEDIPLETAISKIINRILFACIVKNNKHRKHWRKFTIKSRAN